MSVCDPAANTTKMVHVIVSILVLMDVGLRFGNGKFRCNSISDVSILVLMDVGLR